MSNEALTWAFKQTIKSGPKFVLVALADYADECNSCYPNFEQISAKTSIAIRSISRHVEDLEKQGFLTTERTRNSTGNLGRYRYSLHLPIWQVGSIPTCQNRQSLPAKLAGHNPQDKPSITTTTKREREDNFLDKLFKAGGGVINETVSAIYTSTIPARWITGKNSADLALDILPTISRLCEGKTSGSIKSWAYFQNAIFEARDKRLTEDKYSNPEISTRENNAKRSDHEGRDKLDRSAAAAINALCR